MVEGINRRFEGRAGTDYVLEIHDAERQSLVGIGRLLNLSVSGACVDSTSILAGKRNLVIRFLLEKDSLLALPVDLVWERALPHNTREYGLQFGPYAETDRKRVQDFVDNNFGHIEKNDFLKNPPEGSRNF